MTNRILLGPYGGLPSGLRVSLPGYDVLTEPGGSVNINFDTQLQDIGTVVASGLIQCGGTGVVFPTMPYVPICEITRWDGSDLLCDTPRISSAATHTWIPVLAIVTTSSILVRAFETDWFNTLATSNPNGQYFLYSIFANGS